MADSLIAVEIRGAKAKAKIKAISAKHRLPVINVARKRAKILFGSSVFDRFLFVSSRFVLSVRIGIKQLRFGSWNSAFVILYGDGLV